MANVVYIQVINGYEEKRTMFSTTKTGIAEVIMDRTYKINVDLKLDGVYVAIGNEPINEFAKKLGVKCNEKGEIIINHKNSHTNLEGVYAAGDVTDKTFKQLIIGVSEGILAAHSAYEYISQGVH